MRKRYAWCSIFLTPKEKEIYLFLIKFSFLCMPTFKYLPFLLQSVIQSEVTFQHIKHRGADHHLMQTATALIVIPWLPEIFLTGILHARVNFSNNKWLHNFVKTVIFWKVKTVIYTNVLSLMSKGVTLFHLIAHLVKSNMQNHTPLQVNRPTNILTLKVLQKGI